MATVIESKINRMRLPSWERLALTEFSNTLFKNKEQAPTALAHLAKVAFELVIGSGTSHEQKLALARFRGVEARQKLMAAEGGSLSSEEVARLLGISKTAALKRLASGRLLAWREERLRSARFPRWQFDEHGRVLPGLEDVLAILKQDDRLDVWGTLLFFLQEKPSLGNQRPLDLLREGKLKEAALAAGAYAE